MESVDTILKVKITLPKWINKSEGPDSLQKKWDLFYSSLLNHENGHRDFGVKATSDIEKLFKAFASSGSCNALGESTNQKAQLIIEDYKTQEKEYDRLTNHGTLQGAVFP